MGKNLRKSLFTLLCIGLGTATLVPSIAHAQCSSPGGVAGEMEFDTTDDRYEYCNGTSWIDMDAEQFIGSAYSPNAVTFDGSSDYLTRGSDLTGNADSKTMTGSFWFRTNVLLNTTSRIFASSSDRVGIRLMGGGDTDSRDLSITIGSGGSILDLSVSDIVTDTNWHHLMFSIDLSNTSNRHVYIDGVDASPTYGTYVDTLADFTRTNHAIGADPGGAGQFDGGLADFWLDFGTYIDLSDADNRRDFYDNGPVDLGSDGSTPTGSAPIMFFSGDTSTWHTNDGDGGGFTENGALTDAATVPSNLETGLVGHWKLDETSGTTATDSSGNGNDGTMYQDLSGADSVSGKIDTALNFEGTNQTRIDISADPALNNITTLTACAWFNVDTFTNAESDAGLALLHKQYWYLYIDNALTTPILRFGVNTTSVYPRVFGTTTLSAGQWYHACAVHYGVGTTPDLYLNGVEEGTSKVGGTGTQQDDSGSVLRIGAYNTNSFFGNFPGSIDDVRIYNRALSAAEVSRLSICTKPGSMGYNAVDNVLQWCDNNLETYNAGTPGDGGAGCAASGTKIAGSAGTVQYDTTSNKMVFCEGDTWVDIPN